MGRLTKRINAEISKGLTYEAIIYKDIEHHETDFNYKALEKLAHYEDLEEQLIESAKIDIDSMVGEFMHYYNLQKENRLIELPCAVGDLVYMIKNMDSLVIPNLNKPPEIIQIMFGYRHIPLIGINVFLTKEEAEAKLKELEE